MEVLKVVKGTDCCLLRKCHIVYWWLPVVRGTYCLPLKSHLFWRVTYSPRKLIFIQRSDWWQPKECIPKASRHRFLLWKLSRHAWRLTTLPVQQKFVCCREQGVHRVRAHGSRLLRGGQRRLEQVVDRQGHVPSTCAKTHNSRDTLHLRHEVLPAAWLLGEWVHHCASQV
jgi:hypothetical protein